MYSWWFFLSSSSASPLASQGFLDYSIWSLQGKIWSGLVWCWLGCVAPPSYTSSLHLFHQPSSSKFLAEIRARCSAHEHGFMQCPGSYATGSWCKSSAAQTPTKKTLHAWSASCTPGAIRDHRQVFLLLDDIRFKLYLALNPTGACFYKAATVQ